MKGVAGRSWSIEGVAGDGMGSQVELNVYRAARNRESGTIRMADLPPHLQAQAK